MDVLSEVIGLMSKEEIQSYKLYTLRKNADKDRKDVKLFDAIKKGGYSYKEDIVAFSLYGKTDKNSFYRLKNRLVSNVFKSLSVHHFDSTDAGNAFHLLNLSALFYSKGSIDLALHCLMKAEAKCKKVERYDLLEVVYSEMIRISQETVRFNPEEYIEKRNRNSIQFEKLKSIENALAVLNYKLKTTQNYTSKSFDLIPFLEDTVAKLVEDKSLLTPKFKLKVYRAVSQILLTKKEFSALEDYLISTYESFSKEKLFNKSNHDSKLQMLTYLVNTLFKNRKIKDSLAWAKQLQEAMEEHGKSLKDKYQIYYYNALVNNYNVIDKDKSLAILEEIKESDWMKSDPYLGIFVYINLALNWFDKRDFKKSLRNFQQLQLLDQYQKTASDLKFKWAIGELVVRYEIGDADKFDVRFSEMKSKYNNEYNEVANARDKAFLNILSLMNKGEKKKYLPMIKSFIKSSRKDEDLIDYKTWLKSKL